MRVKIAILMSVYEPDPVWLRAQLESLNRQTFGPMELYVRDDASPRFPFAELTRILAETVTNFPWHCERNAENLGSNRTFSRLTEEAQADAFAYCDQDDIWEPEKLAVLAERLAGQAAALAYCDLSLMDASGAPMRGGRQPSGGETAAFFLTGNCVSGCAALVRADVAKAAVPFVTETVYDQWLALCAAKSGRIVHVPAPLVRHRVHGANQTATLKGITTKEDYLQRYIPRDELRLREFARRVDLGAPQRRAEAWMAARVALARGERGAWRRLFALRKVKPGVSLFELALPCMPAFVFSLARRWIARGDRHDFQRKGA